MLKLGHLSLRPFRNTGGDKSVNTGKSEKKLHFGNKSRSYLVVITHSTKVVLII